MAVCDAALEVQETRTYSGFQSLECRSLTSWRSADNVQGRGAVGHWGCPAWSSHVRLGNFGCAGTLGLSSWVSDPSVS